MREPREVLVELLDTEPPAGDLAARLTWLESVATALDGLGEDGREAAVQYRAALGAVVAFTRGSRDPSELEALTATIRAFMARAQHACYGAIAGAFDELATLTKGLERADAKAIAASYREIQAAIARGAPPPSPALERLATIRARRAQG